MKTALMAVLAAVACGGTTRPDTLETARQNQNHDTRYADHSGEPGHKEGGGEAEEMAALPPEVKAFHDTLAPRWHGEHGAQRTAETCAAIPQFHTQADAIAAATPPKGAEAAAWAARAKQLADAVAALDAACKAGDATFEPAFAEVHHRFHAVMEAGEAGGEHGEHGEHHD